MLHDLGHLSSGVLQSEVAHQVRVTEVREATSFDHTGEVTCVTSRTHAFGQMTLEAGRLGNITETHRALNASRNSAECGISFFFVREVVIWISGWSICWKIGIVTLIRRETSSPWGDGSHPDDDGSGNSFLKDESWLKRCWRLNEKVWLPEMLKDD